MRHEIKIYQDDVYEQARICANYIADKLEVDWDTNAMAPQNIDFAAYPIDEQITRVTNLLAEYVPYDERVEFVTTGDRFYYAIPLDMPANWPITEEDNLKKCIEQLLAHSVVRDWLRDAGIQITSSIENDCSLNFNSVYDCLCRRMRPRREMSEFGITPIVRIE